MVKARLVGQVISRRVAVLILSVLICTCLLYSLGVAIKYIHFQFACNDGHTCYHISSYMYIITVI